MPAKHTLHVALTEPLVRYVRDQVAAGRHETASDVVRVALQALIQRDGTVDAPPADAPAGRLDHG